MVRSLLRHDGRFRCAPGGAVGLGEWEDVRAPSQREVLEELMIEHDGVVPIGFALTAVPTASGAALAMDQLARLSQSLGADFDGDHIRWQNDGASETADDDASPSMNEALRDVCSTALTLLAAGADASVEMSLDGLGEAEAMLDAVVRAVS
jgi:hypothetical protein